MILWLFLFGTRFGVLDDLVTFFILHEIWSNIPFFLYTRLGNDFALLPLEVLNDSCKTILLSSPHEMLTSCWKTILLSSSARGFDFLLKNDTSILFRSRFKTDIDLLILLSSFVWDSKLVFKRWFAHLTGLTLDCQSDLFCSGLTLEKKSNL